MKAHGGCSPAGMRRYALGAMLTGLWLLVTALAIQPARAQGPAATEASAAAASGPITSSNQRLRVSVHTDPGALELPGRYNLSFRIVNLGTQAETLDKFHVIPVNEISGLVRNRACATPAVVINPGQEHLIHCAIGDAWSLSNLPSWGNITLLPGRYTILAEAQAVGGSDETRHTTSSAVTLEIRPSVWQVVLGAFAGSLLLALFVANTPSLALRYVVSDAGLTRRGKLLAYLAFWVSAFLAATMFIMLTYRLRDAGAPFTITVNDFYGGIVIGMFGFFLADWLAEKLFVRVKPA